MNPRENLAKFCKYKGITFITTAFEESDSGITYRLLRQDGSVIKDVPADQITFQDPKIEKPPSHWLYDI